MEDDERKIDTPEDGRPAEVREGHEPQSEEQAEEDIPDPSTVENVGY
jgi:hypothetical protein